MTQRDRRVKRLAHIDRLMMEALTLKQQIVRLRSTNIKRAKRLTVMARDMDVQYSKLQVLAERVENKLKQSN